MAFCWNFRRVPAPPPGSVRHQKAGLTRPCAARVVPPAGNGCKFEAANFGKQRLLSQRIDVVIDALPSGLQAVTKALDGPILRMQRREGRAHHTDLQGRRTGAEHPIVGLPVGLQCRRLDLRIRNRPQPALGLMLAFRLNRFPGSTLFFNCTRRG